MELEFPLEVSDAQLAKMKSSYWKCIADTDRDSSLHHFLLIPNDVKPTSIEEKNIPGADRVKENSYYQRATGRPYFEVQVVFEPLKYEISPSDWQAHFLEKCGEGIIEQRIINGNSGTHLDALTKKKMPNGETVISRTTSQKNYDPTTKTAKIVCVKVSCNQDDYPELAQDFLSIATEWNFINRSDFQMAEDLMRYDTEQENKLSFYFPASWSASKFFPKDSIGRYAIYNYGLNKEVQGAVNIFTSGEMSQDQLYQRAIGRYEKEGMVVDLPTLEETKILPVNEYCSSSKLSSVGVVSHEEQGFKGRIEVTIIRTQHERVLIEMVGPNQQDDFLNAARNKRAVDLVIHTLRTSEKMKSVQ